MGTEAQVNRSRAQVGESEDWRPGRPRSSAHNFGMHPPRRRRQLGSFPLERVVGNLFHDLADSELPPMKLTLIDWLVVAAYFVINFLIGLWYRRRATGSADEFFVGGRNVSWWLAGTSMVATTFAADTPLAVTGIVAANGIAGNFRSQTVERTLTRPDIIFSAGDLGNATPGLPIPIAVRRPTGQNFVDLSTQNSMNNATTGSEVAPLGPGVIDAGSSPITINIARMGLQELNSNSFDNLTEEQGFTSFVWGSYDGSTNAPTVYPVGRVNLRMIESIVRTGGN
jgi:hypothetical protein